MNVSSGSWFTLEIICWSCSQKEQEHPKFAEARAADEAAIARGDYNFPGIGLPDDLRPKEAS
jgi:hypothetical protein